MNGDRKNKSQHLYRHFSADNTLLYVGISINAFKRTYQHSVSAQWFDQIKRIEIEHFKSLEEVLAAEAKAINTENPLHNKDRPSVIKPVQLTKASESNWAVERRLDFIALAMNTYFSLRRKHIMEAFGVSIVQASEDIRVFCDLYPGVTKYDAKKKQYVALKKCDRQMDNVYTTPSGDMVIVIARLESDTIRTTNPSRIIENNSGIRPFLTNENGDLITLIKRPKDHQPPSTLFQ